MARQTKKRKHKKKAKSKINRKKLLIVAASLFVILFVLLKVVQGITSGVSAASKNIGTLVTSIFGEGKDTSNVNTDKQFDLQEENNTPKKKYVVYLDVGHGGSDIGYQTESGEMEKDIDLEISKLVSSRLSSQGDISVIVSRNTDKLLSNTDRVEDANKQNADIFVSIHMTGNNDENAQGIQTFYRVESEDASDELATLVQKSAVAYVDLKDRGATPFTFGVLEGNNMPSILIQCGFLSNKEEAKKWYKKGMEKGDAYSYLGMALAEGISQGILSFLDAQG